jgi:hypothetical protein
VGRLARELPGERGRAGWEAAGLALFAAGVTAWFRAGAPPGFPLDDAYIHLAHARNLVEHGELAILPGQASQAVTSPLWTLLLAALYAWTGDGGQAGALLALLTLPLLALGVRALLLQAGTPRWVAWLGGALAALTGPLAWLNASGMESALFAALAAWAAWAVGAPLGAARGRPAWLAGALIGLALLTRIEGVLLAGPAGLLILWEHYRNRTAPWRLLPALLLPAVMLAGFCAWNWLSFGHLLPGTLEAKRFSHGVGSMPWAREAGLLLGAWVDYLRLGLGQVSPWPGGGWLLAGLTLGGAVGLVRRWRSAGIGALLLVTVGLDALYACVLPAQGGAGRYQVLNWLWAPLLAGAGVAWLAGRTSPQPLSMNGEGNRWRMVARRSARAVPTVALAALALGQFAGVAGAWRTGFRGHVAHILEAHGRAGLALAELDGACLPVLAYDIGAVAWELGQRPCQRGGWPQLVDLGAMLDPALLKDLTQPRAIQRLATRLGGEAFLSLPTTRDGRPLCPPLGLEVEGPPGDRTLLDPSGTLELAPVAAAEADGSNPLRWLVEANAPRVAVWRVTGKVPGPSP